MDDDALPARLRAAVRALNALAYDRGPRVARLELTDIEALARTHGLFAWPLSDAVLDARDGGYVRVLRLSPVAAAEDEGHGAVVVEMALRPGLLPLFNLYRHDDEAQREGIAELRARFPGSA